MTEIREFSSSPSDAPKYQHQPLLPADFRLIYLLPGTIHDLLRCTIASTRFYLEPSGEFLSPYTALSYCWGDATDVLPIECDGARLDITRNLYVALRHLRDEEELKTLWVDAICINQSDSEEKSQQVSLMIFIYLNAAAVYSWLGEADEDSDHAMNFLSSFDIRKTVDWKHDEDCRALFRFLKRPYFQRIWVIQENAVASNVMLVCGGKSVPLKALFRAFSALEIFIELSGDGWRPLQPFSEVEAVGLHFLHGKPVGALYTMQRFRKYQATDPRDKIYALLGLLRAGGTLCDYKSSVGDVYKDFVVNKLMETKTLDIFSVPRVQGTISLPSWVPDWSVDSEDPSWLHHTLLFYDGDLPGPWRATSFTQAAPDFDESRQLLGLSGHILDSISWLSLTLTYDQSGNGIDLEVLENWERMIGVFTRARYINNESILDAYWKTLTLNTRQGRDREMKAQFLQWRTNGMRILFRYPLSFLRHTISILLRSEKTPFIQHVGAIHRRLVKTEKGYIALVPKAACIGDQIGLFEGGKLPLVVRSNGEKWQLVGDSYVHGVMYGEAFEQGKCKIMWFN